MIVNVNTRAYDTYSTLFFVGQFNLMLGDDIPERDLWLSHMKIVPRGDSGVRLGTPRVTLTGMVVGRERRETTPTHRKLDRQP